MNTINPNMSVKQQNFKGSFVKDRQTVSHLIDAVEYANVLSKKSKRQPKVEKEVKQFFNTLKNIKNDKTNRSLHLEQNLYKFHDAKHKDCYLFGYGAFQKERLMKRYDNTVNLLRQVIEIGKNVFGEKKINKPISDLDKHRISQAVRDTFYSNHK